MGKIGKMELNYYDWLFSQCHTLNKRITLRKAELAVREVDENVGGGKSNVRCKPIENQVMRELNDHKLQWLEWQADAIQQVLDSLDEQHLALVRTRYFENFGLNTWQDAAQMCGYSTAGAYKIRYTVLEMFANLIGMENTLDY